MEKIAQYIELSLTRKKGGDILFISNFRGIGAETAIRKAFSRRRSVSIPLEYMHSTG